MHFKYPYEIMEIEGRSLAVALEGSDNNVVKLNKTAAAIFKLLQEETNEEAIVEQLSQRFDATREILAKDVHKVVIMFQEKGMLE